MPSSIPYDPSLVLGEIIRKDKIDHLEKISKAQSGIDAAQEELNNLIKAKRQLDMTRLELVNLKVDPKQLDKISEKMSAIDDQIGVAAEKYVTASADGLSEVATLKSNTSIVAEAVESPLDWDKSNLKTMPLAADSMILDAQYIRNESQADGSEAHAKEIASHASTQISSIFGGKAGVNAAGAVASTALSQVSKHNVAGTLVITAVCTHKNAKMFAPLVLDPEKAVDAWNVCRNDDKLTTSYDAICEAIEKDETGEDKSVPINLLSGVTYGSSFVGMVHVLQSEATTSTQTSSSMTSAMETQFKAGMWFSKAQGKFGLDKQFSNNIKDMLSTSDVETHCSVVTMGLIPTLKSNAIKTSIKQLQPDAQEIMSQVNAINGATSSRVSTMGGQADAGKIGSEFKDLNQDYVGSVVSNLSTVDNNNNRIIDTNSLMTAFDDYVELAQKSEIGVPINYYLKPITKGHIARIYQNKFQIPDPDQNKEPGESTEDDGGEHI